jgi:hypothetical protein
MLSDSDIGRSIQKAPPVGEYYKQYGFFNLSKSSQNHANTIPALANFDKAKVSELDFWFKAKVEAHSSKLPIC